MSDTPTIKPKVFQKILKDSYNRHYGVDCKGTLWRIDKLNKKGIPYRIGKVN